MRRNPRGDYKIEDFEIVCRSLSERRVRLLKPRRGSHFKIGFPDGTILMVPARNPIKPVYVKRFVDIVDDIIDIDET